MAMLEIQEEGLSLEQAKALLNGIPGGFHRANAPRWKTYRKRPY